MGLLRYYTAAAFNDLLICPHLRLTAEIKFAVPAERLLISSRLHEIVLRLFEKLRLYASF